MTGVLSAPASPGTSSAASSGSGEGLGHVFGHSSCQGLD